MAFTYPRPNLIVSDLGYTVERGAHAIGYADAEHSLEIDFEWGRTPDGAPLLLVHTSRFKVVGPRRFGMLPPKTVVSVEHKALVIGRVMAAYASKGVYVQSYGVNEQDEYPLRID